MPQISGKRTATSPLASEFNKKPKLELSNEELEELKEELDDDYLPVLSPEDILLTRNLKYLVRAIREVAFIIDKSWADTAIWREFVEGLSHEERLYFASMWIEAREKKDWNKFANHCALLPSHRSATFTALCSPHAGSKSQSTV